MYTRDGFVNYDNIDPNLLKNSICSTCKHQNEHGCFLKIILSKKVTKLGDCEKWEVCNNGQENR